LEELQPGDPPRIGPYLLEGRLGSGGMGRVYLGRSPGGRQVAIKVIRSDLAENPDFRARFAREASAARKVSGIFTAPVVDADLTGQVPWLATAYVPGPSLTDAVMQRGPMPTTLVFRLAAGLAEGLAAIHAAGVVHRDLKPSNVLLAEDGPRLIDFGISRSIENSSLTQTGTVVGSPGFMSPEQAEGRPVGPASDIFSLGAVLTFAATGEGPFGEGSTVALLYRVVTSEPTIQGVPEEIRPLIELCLAKDPLQRPTAAQLLATLSTAEAVSDPERQGTTRKSALLDGNQAPPSAGPAAVAGGAAAVAGVAAVAGGAAGAVGAGLAAVAPAVGAAGAPAAGAAAAEADLAYPATENAAVLPTGPDGRSGQGMTMPPPAGQYGSADQATRDRPSWPPPQPGPPSPPQALQYQPSQYQPEQQQPAPYQPPPYQPGQGQPGPDYYQPPPGPRPRRSRLTWVIASAAVVILAVGAIAFLAGRAHPHPNTGSVNAAASSAASSQANTSAAGTATASATSTPTQAPDAPAMTALGSDLARSASARPAVTAAIANVQNCSESPASGEATIQQAINTRQDILQSLSSLSVSDLPNGPQLISAFTSAMQNSLAADNDYHAWMADLVSSGSSCGANAGQDANYAAAASADSASTAAKTTFVGLWNPLAPQYGQQTYSADGF
jgi:hypothetical protein